ncbi:MAG: acetate--CoA ligase family protein [Deltaproteobacteria bacterium]|nr:acetate--CoA ligase family protein [Deltaproteobacteria bacterium]
MARLYEYQSKELLAKGGLPVPRGRTAADPQQAAEIAAELVGPVVVKAQAWITGRAQAGGVRFADTPDQARIEAEALLGLSIKGFKIREVLVEERLDIEQELFLGLVMDDAAKAPIIVFSSLGGSGIEEIAREHPDKVVRETVDVLWGFQGHQARDLLRRLDIRGKLQADLAKALVAFYNICRKNEARSAEINPLVITRQGRILAADCHMAVDDYAVFRHPELGIEIAREFDRPATDREKVSYQVEAKDHRGTFYFLEMARDFAPRSGYVGFHGAGGGGSMMSMDALHQVGFKIANFCDTSGNPSAAKVYRAARIILSQNNIDGYFASGSGVASQEQFHSARGLVKAFREVGLHLPAVVRIGGNFEEEAIEILERYTADLPAKVEAYGRDTSALYCARRLRELVDHWDYEAAKPAGRPAPDPDSYNYHFQTMTGRLCIDHDRCAACNTKPCIKACTAEILKLDEDRPVLAIDPEQAAKGRCTECLACELACEFEGNKALYIHLPIEGLDEALSSGS